jgi:hypothetical protein
MLTAINNKSQIEISGKRQVGNINTAAMLPSRNEQDAEETKEVKANHCQIDPKYDWY